MADKPQTMAEVVQKVIAEADVLYQFILKYTANMNIPQDYGTGDKLTMIEAHLLTHIEENPAITISELARLWHRTRGAISQQIKKLEERSFVEKRREQGNDKAWYLYLTERGKQVSLAHRMYDMAEITSTVQELLKSCTIDEVVAFYKVTRLYNKMLDE